LKVLIRAVIGPYQAEFCGVKPIKRPGRHAEQSSSFRKIKVIHILGTGCAYRVFAKK